MAAPTKTIMATMNQASDELDESGASDAPEDNQNESSQDTFFLPPDFLGGKKYKKGDKITLEVMGEDEDGDTEVCLAGQGNEKTWQQDLKETMSAKDNAGSDNGGY